MEKLGFSGEEWIRRVENDQDERELVRRSEDVIKQEMRTKLEKSRYAAELKEQIGKIGKVWNEETTTYLKDALEIFYRFRFGSETRSSKFWKSEEERKCRLCGEEVENIAHVLEKCRITGENRKWEKQLEGGRKNLSC